MRTWSADSTAAPAAAWALLSRPDAWPAWSPHLRGAWGLGGDEVRTGAYGAARLLGVLPVPARITARSERAWTWRVGLVEMTHRADPRAGGGCTVAIELCAPGPLEPVIARAYGPVIAFTLRRLARVAERPPGDPDRRRR